MDIVTFVEFDGNPPQTPKEGEILTLASLRDRYLETHRNGSLEQSTLDGIELHFKHIIGTLGERFPIQELSMAELQRHVDCRSKKKGLHGKKLSPATIRKEIVTLRTAWNWGVQFGLLTGRFPSSGLRYPRFTEKPPFQTWEEIERRTAGLSQEESQLWWDCLYLRAHEISDFLKHVKEKAVQPWVYPLCCTAAYSGARRAEMLRMLVSDLAFERNMVLVREMKRTKGKTTTRTVPMAPALVGVLKEWLAGHPGGPWLFAQAGVIRSKSRRKSAQPITHDEAHDHFKRAIKGSKWKVLRGYHVLRHSFISACASKGIDQRLIDEWSGHATDEQRKRYRHLYPSTQQAALASVFGQ